ncbi:DUF4265 domain-containing protein [Myxococcus sp. SDU36]|uniref:DUF4265 domain-containing protein n=1 Tax=Myxococcus sp. SDU36 TaxID=2831967 RepID=UPI002543BC7E|nr:DUF4265 domain-containing protein [Myxococcus sp. SDU36]WIG96639.1 DUF4265 domain-containing protein [Myxococcus sp. SDU36]
MEKTGFVKVYFQLVQDEDDYPPASVESVWAQPGSGVHVFVVGNVPFFTRDATLGDVVLTREVDGQFWFEKVLEYSGNSLIRVAFYNRELIEGVRKGLVALGCEIEFAEQYGLLAVSVPASVNLSDVQEYLQNQAKGGELEYEEPILMQ